MSAQETDTPAPDTTAPATATLRAEVEINGNPAAQNVPVSIIAVEADDGEVCVVGNTSAAGVLVADVSKCAGEEVVAIIRQDGKQFDGSTLTMPALGTTSDTTIRFAVDAEEAVDLGLVGAEPTTEDEVVNQVLKAENQKAESVFEELQLTLIGLLVAGFALLAGLGLAMLRLNQRRYGFLTETFKSVPTDNQDAMKIWQEAMDAESGQASERFKVFRWLVEGLVLSFVVIAIIALGAAGKIEAQGMVSVLAAIVGYAAGRSSS